MDIFISLLKKEHESFLEIIKPNNRLASYNI